MRAFAESVVGMPNSVINYTWHELAETLFGIKVNKNFWMPHFNYMEYINWHEFLAELDTNKKEQNTQTKERKKETVQVERRNNYKGRVNDADQEKKKIIRSGACWVCV